MIYFLGRLGFVVLFYHCSVDYNIRLILLKTLQAQNLQNGRFAAAKMCALEGEDDLSDFMIEIDILSECKHPNIVDLHEAFFNDGKLWVRCTSVPTKYPYIHTVFYIIFVYANCHLSC
jgi:serine/threonine protein kinase